VSSFLETKKKYSRGMTPSLKYWLKLTHSLQKAVSFDTFCLVARQQ